MALTITIGSASVTIPNAKEARLRAAFAQGGLPATDAQLLDAVVTAWRRDTRRSEESAAVAAALADVVDL